MKKNQLNEAKQKVETFQLEAGWYDLWHIHLDMSGQGKKSITKHKKFILLFLELLNKIEKQAKTLNSPWQSFIVIEPNDSSQDAVYFHTPNPNSNNFPYEFEGVNWEIETPFILEGIINNDKYIIGEYHFENNVSYFVKSK